MSKRKDGSYIDTLSSGYESKTVKEYDPSKTEGQLGKEHEEEVAKSNNWGKDKRDSIGRAASYKFFAKKLYRLAREFEAVGMDEKYQDKIEDIAEHVDDNSKGISVEEAQDEPENLDNMTDEEIEEKCKTKASRDEFIIMQATHPIEHNPAQDDPQANMSSQTGDDEWIDIGSASYNDKRDSIERAK